MEWYTAVVLSSNVHLDKGSVDGDGHGDAVCPLG
jgi:hypothetical protein